MNWTIAKIKAANKAAGFHFFEPSTMRFFRSRISEKVYQGPGGVFFVTSEQFEDSRGHRGTRRYTVRRFNPEKGNMDSLGEFNTLSRSQAHTRARNAANAPKGFTLATK